MSDTYRFNGSQDFKVTSPGIGGDAFSTDSNQSRMLPRQISTGSTRGTQTVGYGNTKIDGSNNRITIGTTATVTLGNIPDSSGGGAGVSVSDQNGSYINLGINSTDQTQLVFNDGMTNRLVVGNQTNFGQGIYVSKAGVDSLTNNDPNQWIFNSNQNIFKIIATQTVSILPVTQAAASSGSTSATINLSAYPANAVILPIAIQANNPSFTWFGMHGLQSTAFSGAGGVAGWQVVADYSTTFSGGGNMQLTRTLINASTGSYTDQGYTVKVYVLQESVN